MESTGTVIPGFQSSLALSLLPPPHRHRRRPMASTDSLAILSAAAWDGPAKFGEVI